MSEQIDWLQVVIDYGKRFPDVTLGDLDLNFVEEVVHCKIKDLYLGFNAYLSIKIFNNTTHRLPFGCVGNILYYGYMDGTWNKVPQHILLRLLSEGKEDLI